MPRFFIEVGGSDRCIDPLGEIFADLSEAKAAVDESAKELISDYIAVGKCYSGVFIALMQDDKREVYRIDLSSVSQYLQSAPRPRSSA